MSHFVRHAPPDSLPGRAGSSGAGGCKYFFLGVGLVVLGVAVLAILGIVAYALLSGQPFAPVAQLQPSAAGPDIAFQEPASGARLAVGESVLVFATARDANRVTRVDLWVDDQLAIQQSAPDPNGLTPFSLIHSLVAAKPGTYALTARAYNALGVMGESTRVYVTVFDQPAGIAPPDEAQYVVQPGDTVEDIAKLVGVSEQTIRDANPGMSDDINPGDLIAVPAPETAFAPPVEDPQNAPGLVPNPSSDSAVMILPGLMPNANWKQILNPSNARINAPVLQKAEAGNCTVTLAWTDNSDNETNFAVLRRGKNQFEKSIVKTLNANTTQYQDTVSQPDTYEYTIAAAQAQGLSVNQVAYSNPRSVTVPVAAGCAQSAAAPKQVFFRPLKFAGADAARSAIWYGVGDGTIQRIPAGQGQYGIGGGAPVAVPINLRPGEPLTCQVRGAAASDTGIADLGGLTISYSPDELARSGGVMKEGKAEKFSLAYELWIEDPAWRAQPAPTKPAPPAAAPTKPAQPTTAPATSIVATFKDLTVSKPATGAIRLFANEVSRASNLMLVGAAPYRLDNVFLNGMMPNHSLNVNMGSNESLQLGFNVSNLCQSDAVIIKPPAEGWRQFDRTYPIQSKDGMCKATVQVKSSAAPLAQSPQMPTRPRVDVVVESVKRIGEGYRLELGLAPCVVKDVLTGAVPLHVRQKVLWGATMLSPSGGGGFGGDKVSSRIREERTRDYDLVWGPPRFHCWFYIDLGSPRNVGDEPLTVSVTPLDFDDPDLSNNDYNPQFGMRLDGYPCARSNECLSGYCADGKFCAPKNDTGKAGAYCHHDDHCASGLCVCPDGWESGDKGFCRGWQNFTTTKHGVCSVQSKNGEKCTQNKDCASGYCADGKLCAPKDGTGKAGAYCHHDNQCATGLCLCPDGWEGNRGFCKGWQDFTPTKAGKCSAKLENGANCTQNKDCASGSCADGKKCAPVDFTGKAGAYCHHDNHCAKDYYCSCPNDNRREGWPFGGFCLGWRNFTSTTGGVCTKR